jgi:2-polyprenyl-3-methyl-5-hydroxy-6-metoxy-1,4-benzoquinol methylase
MSVSEDPYTSAYRSKSDQYFDGARADMISYLPDDPYAKLLEIGCGFGGTGALALAQGKCNEYVGIEISESAAAIAREKLSTVVVGNVETIELPWPEESFNGLIISEVLEHLVDPLRTLKRVAPYLRPGAVVMASSPNISQYKVIRSLIFGRWELTQSGVMDRTHLRWFTPLSYRAMFEEAGFTIDWVKPVTPFSMRTRVIDRLTLGRFSHLFIRQIMIFARKAS